MILPPYARLLGLVPRTDDDGRPLLEMPFAADAIGGMLEMAAYVALRDALGDDAATVTIKPINVTIDFMRGGRERTTFAAGTVTRRGARIANVTATAWQDDRTAPIAAGRMNYLLRR